MEVFGLLLKINRLKLRKVKMAIYVIQILTLLVME